jgi:aryl-alcohol dehydrogenase
VAVDISDERLSLAREFGATETFNGLTGDAVAFIRSITEDGVLVALDTTGVPSVMQQAVAATAPRGTCGWLAGVNPTLEVPVNPTFLLPGRKVQGIIEGESHDPETFINQLIDWYMEGSFPFDRMCQFYPFEAIDQAFRDSLEGRVIKPIVRF